MKRLLILAVMAMMTMGAAFAQKDATVMIQTNASKNCSSCAARFEQNVPFFKGVKSYSYDKATGKLSIQYDAKKTSPEKLRTEISKMGYNADDVKADEAARAKLPACCRAEGSCGHDAKSGEHKCSHQCQGAQGEHKCQHAEGQKQCQGPQGEHKCSHQCQGANGQHQCPNATNGEHKCNHQSTDTQK